MRVLAAFVLLAAPAYADPQRHYKPNIPEGYAQALHQMETVSKQLQAAERANDLRSMHELSYDLEASVEVMQRELDALAEQVEVMHVASEKNQKEKAKQAYRELAPKVQALSK